MSKKVRPASDIWESAETSPGKRPLTPEEFRVLAARLIGPEKAEAVLDHPLRRWCAWGDHAMDGLGPIRKGERVTHGLCHAHARQAREG